MNDFDAGGVTMDVGLEFGEDFIASLAFYKADVALGESLVRENGLRSGAAIAAVEAVDGEGGPGGEACGDAAVLGLIELLQVEGLFDAVGVDRELGECCLLQWCLGLNVVVEAVDGYFALFVFHGSEEED